MIHDFSITVISNDVSTLKAHICFMLCFLFPRSHLKKDQLNIFAVENTLNVKPFDQN